MKIFSSTYLARHRLEVLSCASEEPIGITHYGVLSYVLVSATEYERLSGVCIFPNLECEERSLHN
jgi:PHD/YefM family antitoxin component YafN of YafNO toxin-antitoxin module